MKLVFATHNQNKVDEVKIAIPQTFQLLSLNDLNCYEEIPETGETLEENAKIKADFVTQNYGLPCFADDTGLLVEVLNGAPGVYSARYAGPEKDAEANMDKLLHALNGETNRHAHFKTCIALNLNDTTTFFTGTVQGTIIFQKRGDKGFGYDPIFQPNGYEKTFAQLPLVTKNSIGHRGKAVQKLIHFLTTLQK